MICWSCASKRGADTRSIVLRRGGDPVPAAPAVPAALPAGQAASEGANESPAGGADAGGQDLTLIRAPMVGTFYRSPSPDEPPFVSPGDNVKEGDTLCIIEAMKLMNHIETDYNVEIVEALAENAAPVEYGQPLFRVRRIS